MLLPLVLLLSLCVAMSQRDTCDFKDGGGERLIAPCDLASQPAEGAKRNVIALIISEIKVADVKDLLAMFDKNFLDDMKSDVILFHDLYPFRDEIKQIRTATKRNVDFVSVKTLFNRLSCHEDFNPYSDDPNWFKRDKWSYQNMIRFWFSDIFRLDVMKNVDHFMRFDDDSAFTGPVDNLFDTMKKAGAVYLANEQIVEVGRKHLPGIELLEPTVRKYVNGKGIVAKNADKWKNTFIRGTVNTFYNNFEIVKVDFMLQPEVSAFILFILSTGGIYRYRWGDAALRFITMSLFASDQQVLHRDKLKIQYCHACDKKKVYQGVGTAYGKRHNDELRELGH